MAKWKNLVPPPLALLIGWVAVAWLQAGQVGAQPIHYVIHISMDGMRPDGVTALGPAHLTNFYRLRREGATTDNARADYDYTVTLPNHTCQLTGRGVVGPTGHNWTSNADPAPGQTLASNKGSYIAGSFDVAHDHGLRTGAYVSKSKFSLFQTSWNDLNGAPDVTGPDNGRNKLDAYVYDEDTAALVDRFVTDMAAQPFNYAFIHLRDLDSTGHALGWDVTPGSAYSEAVKTLDGYLGSILELVSTHPLLAGHTAIVLTADHGGVGYDHSDPTLREDYTIPFYVWGPGVMAGADLYVLNQATRLDPGTDRPGYSAPVQPIRNGEAANLVLKLLGLAAVPGSTINPAQNLAVTVSPLPEMQFALAGGRATVRFPTMSNVLYDLQSQSFGPWTHLQTNLVGNGQAMTVDVGPITGPCQFFRLRLHF